MLSREDKIKLLKARFGEKKLSREEKINLLKSRLKEEDSPSVLSSSVRQFNQGVTGNFGDEIAGAVDAVGRVVGVKGLGSGDIADLSLDERGPTLSKEEIARAYREGRDKERALIARDEEVNPRASNVAGLVGAVASPINKMTKGLSLAKGAGVYAGVSAAGASEDETIKGLTFDTATGTLAGLVIGKGGEKLFPLVGNAIKMGAPIGRGAEKLAHKAMGSTKGLVRKMGKEKARESGRFALDNNVLGWFNSADDQVLRNKKLQEKAGQQMDEVYGAIDKARPSDFIPTEVAKKINKKHGGIYRTDINKDVVHFFDNAIGTIKNFGQRPIPLRRAQKLKEMIDAPANWGKAKHLDLTEKEQIARKVSTELKKEIEKAVESGAKELNSKPLLDKFLNAKKLYGKTKNVEKFLENQVATEEGNKAGLGLIDALAATSGYGYGQDAGSALGFVLAVRMGRSQRAVQMAAKSLDKISKAVDLPGEFIESIGRDKRMANAFVSMFDDKVLSLSKELKGANLWRTKGFSKLYKHANGGIFEDPEKLEFLIENKKAQRLMREASGVKPGSKRMNSIYKKLEEMVDDGSTSN